MSGLSRRQVLKGAVGVGVLGTVAGPRAALAGEGNHEYRWDIVNNQGPCTEAGGEASSKSRDGARITMTGSGTFRDNPGKPQDVTGGGSWRITAGTATPAGSGTYEVTRFISFDLPPGANPPRCDNIGDFEDRRPGRLTLAIAYDDGSDGVLEVGCRLATSPASVMEGITATKGYVTFWNHEEPVGPGVEGNRTIFHLLR